MDWNLTKSTTVYYIWSWVKAMIQYILQTRCTLMHISFKYNGRTIFQKVHELYFVYEIMPMEDNAVIKFSTWINADLKTIYLIG